MQLIIVTGLSGGGKSIAIRQLEDSGFYCIDNLPAEFLLPIAENLEKNGTRAAAVAIDARSHATFENAFTALEALMSAYFFSLLPMKSFCGDSLKLAADIL